MKHIILIAILALSITACGNKNKSAESTTKQEVINIDDAKTTVIYFHSNHRCATCMAVENVSREAVKENFKDEVPFYHIDVTLDESKALMEKYKIGGQSLVVVKGGKKIDITSEAFMYARSKPEKVKANIKATIDSLQ